MVRWFSRGSIEDRVWWRTQGGYRRVAWLGSGESCTQNRTRVPTRPRFPQLARVSRRYACTALQTAIRPTYNMFMYRRATLTLQFMRALTGPQPLGLLSVPRSPHPPPAGPLNTTANLPTRFDVQVHLPQEGRAPRLHGLSPSFCIRKPAFVVRAARCFIFSSICTRLPVVFSKPADEIWRNSERRKVNGRRSFREDRNGQARAWRTCGQV